MTKGMQGGGRQIAEAVAARGRQRGVTQAWAHERGCGARVREIAGARDRQCDATGEGLCVVLGEGTAAIGQELGGVG